METAHCANTKSATLLNPRTHLSKYGYEWIGLMMIMMITRVSVILEVMMVKIKK